MRWLRGLPLRAVTACFEGGFCEGSGLPIRPDDNLYFTLAGFAAESCYGLFGMPDWDGSHAEDLDEARAVLGQCPWLHGVGSLNARLTSAFEATCKQLLPHDALVEYIGSRLEYEGRLSARSVAAICREYGKREGAR